jgi:hypothetical protein
MSGFEVEVSDDFEGESSFLTKPGTYHVIIEDVKVGVGPRGNAFEGATVQLSVLAGTVESEVKKTFNHMIGFPKATDKDGGKFRTKVLSKFLLAANQVTPADKGKKIAVDPERLIGQQLVVTIDHGKKNDDGKSFLEIDNGGLAVYHVDDPNVAAFPKDQAALKVIPAGLRHDKAWFDQVYAKKPAPVSTTTPATPAVDISQL